MIAALLTATRGSSDDTARLYSIDLAHSDLRRYGLAPRLKSLVSPRAVEKEAGWMAACQLTVTARSTNGLALAGAVAYLEQCPDVQVILGDDPGAMPVDVTVIVEERINASSLRRTLRAHSEPRQTPTVLVTREVTEACVDFAVTAGVVALVRLDSATAGPDLVAAVLCAGRGGASFPPSMQRLVTTRLRELREQYPGHNLSRRELDALAMLADGFDTRYIAEKLSYSERTIKYLLHGVMSRLGVRTRVEAVAYAIRNGLC